MAKKIDSTLETDVDEYERKQKKQKKKKDYRNFFYYLNPKSLSGEIKKYGYTITPMRAIFNSFIIVALAILMAVVFKLQVPWIIALVICWLILFPAYLVTSFKGLYENTRFADVNTYIEQFLYSFRKQQKILNALNDVIILFPEGPMHNILQAAIDHIMTGDINGDVTKEALDLIEEAYPCSRIKNLHKFALTTEQNGGDPSMSIDLLLNDRRLWSERTAESQVMKKDARNKFVVSSFLSLGICASLLYMSGTEKLHMDTNAVCQTAAVIAMFIDMLIYIKINQKINVTMLDIPGDKTEEIAVQDLIWLKNYDPDKARKRSFKFCIIPFIILVIGIIFKNIFVGCGAILLAILIICNKDLSKKLREKSVSKEVEKKFSEWLMEVSLLTQYNTIMVALDTSIDTAPTILKEELKSFIEKAKSEPNSIKPYIEFMDILNLPQIQSAMRMLYSISNGTGGDVQAQSKTLIEQNTILMDRAEKIKTETQVAGFNALIYLPTLTGSFKLLVDMTIMLFGFMSLM